MGNLIEVLDANMFFQPIEGVEIDGVIDLLRSFSNLSTTSYVNISQCLKLKRNYKARKFVAIGENPYKRMFDIYEGISMLSVHPYHKFVVSQSFTDFLLWVKENHKRKDFLIKSQLYYVSSVSKKTTTNRLKSTETTSATHLYKREEMKTFYMDFVSFLTKSEKGNDYCEMLWNRYKDSFTDNEKWKEIYSIKDITIVKDAFADDFKRFGYDINDFC